MIYVGDQQSILYKGDQHPASFYKGSNLVAGYEIEELVGTLLSFEYTYNDKIIDLLVNGLSNQVEGVWGTNLINSNSDFSDGITGWYAQSATQSATNGILTNIANGTVIYGSEYHQITNGLVSGKKYYIKPMVRVRNSDCATIRFWTGSASIIYQSAPEQDVWYNHGFVFTAGGNYPYLNIYHYYANAATASGKAMEIDCILPMCLTDEFCNGVIGTGNEPTAAEMDAMLAQYPNNWFDGSALLTTDAQFTPNSPSPDYPADISSLSGELGVSGKNLFDWEYAVSENAEISNATFEDKNCISWEQGTTAYNIRIMEGMFEPNHSYAITFSGKSGDPSYPNVHIAIKFTDGTAAYLVGQDWDKVTYVSPNNKTINYISGVWYTSLATAHLDINVMQVERGSTITDYMPYKDIVSETIPTLNGLPAAGVYDTYEPYVEVDGVMRSRHTQRIGVKVFDGTETINYNASYTAFYYASVGGVGGKIPMCTHLNGTAYGLTSNDNVVQVNPTTIWMSLDTFAGDINAFKAWLAAQYAAGTPVTVHYVLSTPIVTLGDPVTMPTYPGQTNIYTDADAQLSASARVEV